MKTWANIRAVTALVAAGLLSAAAATIAPTENPSMPPKELFQKLVGKWSGTAKTWFEPDKLEDESKVAGEFTLTLGDRYLRHAYTGSMKGKPRAGEEMIAFNPITKKFQVSWIDDFHMNSSILFSEGDATEKGFSVLGSWDTGENQPKWGWRTEYTLIDDEHLTVTAYVITPEGAESKGVETVYERVK